jgi:ribonuclease HII
LTTIGQWFSEAFRLRLMRSLEEKLNDVGILDIAGVDEAGRGCLAGPVVAAAVVVLPGRLVPGVDDSKTIPAERRERLAEQISRAHPCSAVVAIEAAEIDSLNILEATRRAMVRALLALPRRPAIALIDAVPLRIPEIPTLSVVRGDLISYAVACASILAKVARDRMMVALDLRFPTYGFAQNKGYGSLEHRRTLAEIGPCEAHRLSFRSVLPRLDEPLTGTAGGGSWR